MNWPLARFLALWTAVVGTALAAGRVPVRPASPNAWVHEHPLRTAGCPALDEQLAAWQRQLALTDWQIQVTCGIAAPKQDNLGLSRSHPESKRAEIFIHEGMSRGWQQVVLLHELAHVGVFANRWWVPEGWDEEDYMDAIALNFFDQYARDVRWKMLATARQRAGRLPGAASAQDVPAIESSKDSEK